MGGFDLMGDEDGSQELPQRSRGAARGGSDRSAPSVSPVLSEELRQRIQAAVKAERADAAAKDGQTTTERPGRETVSAPADGGVAGPAVNGIGGARKHERAAGPERLGKPEAVGKSERLAGPKAAVRAESDEQPERATKNGTSVKPPPAMDRPASPKPAVPGHGRTPARGRTSQSGHPGEITRKESLDRRLARIRLVALALVLVVVGSLVTVISLHIAKSSNGNSGVSAAVLQRQEALERTQAATWVTQQVNPDDVVSCDQAMCNALRADGFPASKLLVLGPTSQPPVTSAVVVVTETVRDLFGSSIGSAWAPAVLASIGSGVAAVTIRVIAPHGIGTYQAQLKAGLEGRKNYGKVLLDDNRIRLSNTAQQQLASGQVDPRLVLATASLAGAEPIYVQRFGNVGPGASASIPLRYADLAMTDSAAHLASAAYVQAMQTRLSGLDIQFRPARSQLVAASGGRVFRVEFTAPSPLGLISGSP
jgi:hypothetical protein